MNYELGQMMVIKIWHILCKLDMLLNNYVRCL